MGVTISLGRIKAQNPAPMAASSITPTASPMLWPISMRAVMCRRLLRRIRAALMAAGGSIGKISASAISGRVRSGAS